MAHFRQYLLENLDIKAAKAMSQGLKHISFDTYEDQSGTRYHWQKDTQVFELTNGDPKTKISFQSLSNGNVLFVIDGKRYDYYITDWALLNHHIQKYRKQPGKLLNWVKKNALVVPETVG